MTIRIGVLSYTVKNAYENTVMSVEFILDKADKESFFEVFECCRECLVSPSCISMAQKTISKNYAEKKWMFRNFKEHSVVHVRRCEKLDRQFKKVSNGNHEKAVLFDTNLVYESRI